MWLQKLAEELGRVFFRAKLSGPENAVFILRADHVGGIVAVVDASGREFDDPDSFPSRGRLVIAEKVFDKTVRHYSCLIFGRFL